MIKMNKHVEKDDSKPLARRFQSDEHAHAYVLGLEDAKRALGAHRLLGMDPWQAMNQLWMETKEHHPTLDIPDPPDLEYSANKRQG